MTNDRTILITGVTGQQGGAVAQALQGSGFHRRCLTRKPDSERAATLARQGIDIVKGDLDDEATLRRALAGAWGLFSVQNAGRRAPSGKRRRGSVSQPCHARPASNIMSTHPWDRRTKARAFRTSTTRGASRKRCAASASPRM